MLIFSNLFLTKLVLYISYLYTMPENNENCSSGFLDWFVKFITRTNLNRIWRSKFITASIIFSIILWLIVSPLKYLWTMFDKVLSYPVISISVSVLLAFVSIYWTVVINNKRFHDFGKSWWWQLLLFVPLANIVMIFIMCLVPWDKEDNEFWSASETSTFEKICAWLLPLLVAIIICWAFASALLPRLKHAQSDSYDAIRIADLSSLQNSILNFYNLNWEYPLRAESSNWIPVTDLIPKLVDNNSFITAYDPNLSVINSWLWDARVSGTYLYMVTKKNTIDWWWFALLAKTDNDARSNWVVCDNWEWNIPAWYDLRDFKVCSSVNKWNSCSNDLKWNCTYSSEDELRYILTF